MSLYAPKPAAEDIVPSARGDIYRIVSINDYVTPPAEPTYIDGQLISNTWYNPAHVVQVVDGLFTELTSLYPPARTLVSSSSGSSTTSTTPVTVVTISSLSIPIDKFIEVEMTVLCNTGGSVNVGIGINSVNSDISFGLPFYLGEVRFLIPPRDLSASMASSGTLKHGSILARWRTGASGVTSLVKDAEISGVVGLSTVTTFNIRGWNSSGASQEIRNIRVWTWD